MRTLAYKMAELNAFSPKSAAITSKKIVTVEVSTESKSVNHLRLFI